MISDHKMLFPVTKEIIENSNSFVVISLSKVGENELVHPIYKVELSYCNYLEMFKLRKNERYDLYTFPRVVTYESLTGMFQEDPIKPFREIAWRSYQFGTNNTFSEDHVISAKGLS